MGFEDFHPSHWYFSDLREHAFLVTFVLLLFFAFLFFRLVHYLGRHFPVVAATTLTIRQHTIAIPAASLGLDVTIMNSLPIFIHRSSVCSNSDTDTCNSFRESECSICLGLYEEEEMVKVMPECLHAFHSDCVDEWQRNRSTCPLCRSSLDTSTESVIE